MWQAFKNLKSGTVHAVSLPTGMSPHGSAIGWALVETPEPLSCHYCLQFAFQWCNSNPELMALLPADVAGNAIAERMEIKI
jgi:hypothetical protein